MRFLARTFFIPILFVFCFLLLASNIQAEGEFETNYDVIYSVDAENNTAVTQKIELKNKTPNYYAERFELKIGSTKVSNVKASDNTGDLETEVKFENNLTSIGVKFNQKVIGTDKTLTWTLSYTSSELASKAGQIWEISIPKLAKSSDINKYEARIQVPKNFGPIAFSVPSPVSENIGPNVQEFSFNKDQLIESGISMSFGKKQVFSFKLNYVLENNNVTSQIQQITLPPDNNYQQIDLEKLEPKPIDVIVDSDGNFIAKYKLASKESLTITAEGFAEVFHKPFRNIYPKLSKEDKQLYLQPQRYWETDNVFIKDKAAELKTADQIYQFVISFLNYNEDRLNQSKIDRKGAVGAYTSPKEAICMEFTDLFIAIARAAGIPAREVTGYAYTQNERLRPLSLALSTQDILHAWPEYWDDNVGWIQIDPTWGSTSGGLDYFNKLDFNHITFVQRGISSTEPVPAGSFKKRDQENEKSVFINFSSDLPQAVVNPQIDLKSPNIIISKLPLKIIATVTNSGSTTIYDQKLIFGAEKLKVQGVSEYLIPILPPFASRRYDFRLQSPNALLSDNDVLTLSYVDAQISKPVTIKPIYNIVFSQFFKIAVFLILIISLVSFLIYKKLNISQKNLLRLPKI